MRGIDSEGLDNIKQRIVEFQNSIQNEMTSVSRQFLEVSDSINGTDLLFLTDKIREEINQFERIKQNNENYATVLFEVIKSYHSQNDTIRDVLDSVTPR